MVAVGNGPRNGSMLERAMSVAELKTNDARVIKPWYNYLGMRSPAPALCAAVSYILKCRNQASGVSSLARQNNRAAAAASHRIEISTPPVWRVAFRACIVPAAAAAVPTSAALFGDDASADFFGHGGRVGVSSSSKASAISHRIGGVATGAPNDVCRLAAGVTALGCISVMAM